MSGRPKLSQALCVARLGAPVLASQHRQGPGCNPGKVQKSPPCAKGGQTVADGQGGLTAASVVNDTSRRAWASSAKCPQSFSRRSPTAPFAQGSRLCCSTYNRPPRVDNKKLPRWGSFFAFHLVLLSSAEAVRCPDSRSSLCPSKHNRQRQRQERVQRHAAGGAGASRPRAHTAGESMAAAARRAYRLNALG